MSQTSAPPRTGLGRFSPRTSIAGRLILWFLLIALGSCGLLAGILYDLSSRSLEETYRSHLTVVGQRKSAELDAHAAELRRTVTLLGHAASTVDAVRELQQVFAREGTHSERYREVLARHRQPLEFAASLYGYPEVLLVSPRGEVLLTLGSSLPGLAEGTDLRHSGEEDSELAGVFDRVSTLMQEEISDFRIYPGMQAPAAFAAAPIMDNGAIAGVVMVQLNNKALYEVITDGTGLGESGETVVAKRVGNEAVVVAPMRSLPEAAFKVKVPLDSKSSPQVRAVQGQSGFASVIDYRGVPCLAVWTFNPTFRWGLWVKQDTAEALQLVFAQRKATLWALAALLLPLTLAALFVAHSLSRPIVFAARVAGKVAAGDLTVELRVNRTDETGLLLRALRAMVESLGQLLGKIQRASNVLGTATTQISRTAHAQQSNIVNFSGSASEVAAASRQITATGAELLNTMEQVAKAVSDTSSLADVGHGSLRGMDQTMHQLTLATDSLAERLALIAGKAKDISGVVQTMTQVADQTNLLSLNAAMEAEKAGQLGLGFAVVAREIRRLADQTAVGTLDIEKTVKDMQSSIDQSVDQMAQFRADVARGVEAAARTGHQLQLIIDKVREITPQFEAASSGMRAQSDGARQISDAMVELNAMAQSSAASIQDFILATDDLFAAAGGLQEELQRFRTEA